MKVAGTAENFASDLRCKAALVLSAAPAALDSTHVMKGVAAE